MYRTRKTAKAYGPQKRRKAYEAQELACPFCTLDERPVLEETAGIRIVPNKFPYEFWDGHNVIEHLLLVPKRHVEDMSQLTDTEKVEAINLMAEYERNGYSVYWRSQTNSSRTVPHQHTHLIKIDDKKTRLSIFSSHPYFVWKI